MTGIAVEDLYVRIATFLLLLKESGVDPKDVLTVKVWGARCSVTLKMAAAVNQDIILRSSALSGMRLMRTSYPEERVSVSYQASYPKPKAGTCSITLEAVWYISTEIHPIGVTTIDALLNIHPTIGSKCLRAIFECSKFEIWFRLEEKEVVY